MAVSFGCPLVGTIGELETRVLKIGQRAYATNATYEDLHPEQEDGKIVSFTPWKTGDGKRAFKDLPWDKNMSGDDDANFKTAFRYIKTYDTLQDFEILPKGTIKIGDSFIIKKGGSTSKIYDISIDISVGKYYKVNNKFYYIDDQINKYLPNSLIEVDPRFNQATILLKYIEDFEFIELDESVSSLRGWVFEDLDNYFESKLSDNSMDFAPAMYYKPPEISCKNGDILSWIGEEVGWKNLCGENESGAETIENKSTIIDDNADDTKYPTTKAVKTFVESKIGSGGNVNLDNYYTKKETDSKISSVYRYCGSVNDLNSLPNLTIGGDIGYTYNVINNSSRSFTYEKSLGGVFDEGLLIITDGEGNNISSLFPRGSIITCDNGDIL